jgi:hypothetical protein
MFDLGVPVGWHVHVVCLGWCTKVLIWLCYMYGTRVALTTRNCIVLFIFSIYVMCTMVGFGHVCYVYGCWIQACMF